MTNPNDPAFSTEILFDQKLHAEAMKEQINADSGPLGLSKREYFAAMAMQALVCNPANFEFFQRTKIQPKEVREETAKTAIQFADALIAELNK